MANLIKKGLKFHDMIFMELYKSEEITVRKLFWAVISLIAVLANLYVGAAILVAVLSLNFFKSKADLQKMVQVLLFVYGTFIAAVIAAAAFFAVIGLFTALLVLL